MMTSDMGAGVFNPYLPDSTINHMAAMELIFLVKQIQILFKVSKVRPLFFVDQFSLSVIPGRIRIALVDRRISL